MTSIRLLDYLPRGNLLVNAAWRKRHNLLLWISGLSAPALCVLAVWLWRSPPITLSGLLALVGCTVIGAIAASIGFMIFRRSAEEGPRKPFTAELLVNLARRNQSMLYRQLAIINQLQDKESDPDTLGQLFRLDYLATRICRNSESLLVLAGQDTPRIWREPVALIDVVRAAIAQTDDRDRVSLSVDERLMVLGHSVADLTHMLAELIENAVRFSPPETGITMRTRRCLQPPGVTVLTIEDWGVGMELTNLAQANALLRYPGDVDLSASSRLGLRVVARLAARHGISVSLSPTPGSGLTVVVTLPAELFAGELVVGIPRPRGASSPRPAGRPALGGRSCSEPNWDGWWTPARPAVVGGSGASAPAAYPDRRQGTSAVARPATGAQPPAGDVVAGQPLARRVPQANLAPELRRPKPAGDADRTQRA